MRKNYNYTRRKLFLPEYGRHIQEMVDALLEIEDRRERTRQAKAVIAVMGDVNPLLRDTAEFTHKLWDHLFIMSDFKLDVDSPYPQPTRQELTVSPSKLEYPQDSVPHKQYGKYVGRMLAGLGRASKAEGGAEIGETVDNIARFMSLKSYEYNQEHPNCNVIAKDIYKMSGEVIEMGEETLNNLRNEYKQHFLTRQQMRQNNNRKGSKGQKTRNQQQGRQQGHGDAAGMRQQKNNAAKYNPNR